MSKAHSKAGPNGDRITAIEPLERDPNLRRVRIGRRSVATLAAADLETLQVAVGDAWTPELQAQIERAQSRTRARKVAMSLLARRGFSAAEMTDRLAKRGFEPAIADEVVADLREHGWIDDRALADDVARAARRSGPAAERLLRKKMKERKIDAEIAADIAAESSSDDPLADAEAFARKRLSGMKNVAPPTAARRVAAALARRGFDEDVVEETLRRLGLVDGD